MKIYVQNDQWERALRKFKKKMTDSNKLQDLKDREFYEKPTTKRRKARSAAKNRWQRQLQSSALPPKLF